jgi:MTH538 TIR-like domain (DUF1863)
MGRKIFVSYKYSDGQVQSLPNTFWTTCRHYVDRLSEILDAGDHIYKGEEDGQSLADFEDERIASLLRNKIFDSSLTIVMISKGMKEAYTEDKNQWIPWEISYSLKEHSRDGRTSLSNAMLAIVIPDTSGSYDYFIKDNTCAQCNCTTYLTDTLFSILRENMFNHLTPQKTNCMNHTEGNRPYVGECSYIPSVKWGVFVNSVSSSLERAYKINENIKDYKVVKVV